MTLRPRLATDLAAGAVADRVAPGNGVAEAVLEHLDGAHRFARWLVRDPSLAEDVVQDAAVRALAHAATFRGGDARAWLMRIVRHAAYDALARRPAPGPGNRDSSGDDDAAQAVADPADDPEAVLMRREAGDNLTRLVEALPEDQRTCLVLREFEGLSYKEIAGITGVPTGTVMSRLWRARQTLMAGRPGGGRDER